MPNKIVLIDKANEGVGKGFHQHALMWAFVCLVLLVVAGVVDKWTRVTGITEVPLLVNILGLTLIKDPRDYRNNQPTRCELMLAENFFDHADGIICVLFAFGRPAMLLLFLSALGCYLVLVMQLLIVQVAASNVSLIKTASTVGYYSVLGMQFIWALCAISTRVTPFEPFIEPSYKLVLAATPFAYLCDMFMFWVWSDFFAPPAVGATTAMPATNVSQKSTIQTINSGNDQAEGENKPLLPNDGTKNEVNSMPLLTFVPNSGLFFWLILLGQLGLLLAFVTTLSMGQIQAAIGILVGSEMALYFGKTLLPTRRVEIWPGCVRVYPHFHQSVIDIPLGDIHRVEIAPAPLQQMWRGFRQMRKEQQKHQIKFGENLSHVHAVGLTLSFSSNVLLIEVVERNELSKIEKIKERKESHGFYYGGSHIWVFNFDDPVPMYQALTELLPPLQQRPEFLSPPIASAPLLFVIWVFILTFTVLFYVSIGRPWAESTDNDLTDNTTPLSYDWINLQCFEDDDDDYGYFSHYGYICFVMRALGLLSYYSLLHGLVDIMSLHAYFLSAIIWGFCLDITNISVKFGFVVGYLAVGLILFGGIFVNEFVVDTQVDYDGFAIALSSLFVGVIGCLYGFLLAPSCQPAVTPEPDMSSLVVGTVDPLGKGNGTVDLLRSDIEKSFGLNIDLKSKKIVSVEDGTAAKRGRLEPGMEIVAVNGTPIEAIVDGDELGRQFEKNVFIHGDYGKKCTLTIATTTSTQVAVAREGVADKYENCRMVGEDLSTIINITISPDTHRHENIGFSWRMVDGDSPYMLITHVDDDSAASRCGIVVGTRVIAYNGIPMSQFESTSVAQDRQCTLTIVADNSDNSIAPETTKIKLMISNLLVCMSSALCISAMAVNEWGTIPDVDTFPNNVVDYSFASECRERIEDLDYMGSSGRHCDAIKYGIIFSIIFTCLSVVLNAVSVLINFGYSRARDGGKLASLSVVFALIACAIAGGIVHSSANELYMAPFESAWQDLNRGSNNVLIGNSFILLITGFFVAAVASAASFDQI